MNSPDPKQQRWEASLDAALKNLPPRRAPVSLENRGLAAIAVREARPWWRKSYSHWPLAMRLVFLVATAALAAGTVWFLVRGLGNSPVAAAEEALAACYGGWIQARSALGGLVDWVKDSLSPTVQLWIFGAAGIIALCYATVIGAGAALYRIFWRAQ